MKKMIVFIIGKVFAWICTGVLVMFMWEWFAMSLFASLPPLSIMQAAGLYMLASELSGSNTIQLVLGMKLGIKDDSYSLLDSMTITLVVNAMLLALAFILHIMVGIF